MLSEGKIHPAVDPTGKIQKVTDTIDRLYRRGALRPLRRIMTKLHSADLAAALSVLPDAHIAPVFEAVPEARMAGEVLVQLGAHARDTVLEETPLEKLTPALEQLPPDELTDLIQQLDPELAERLVVLLEQDSKEELEGLLRYEQDTAGGIMTPDFVALADSVSAAQAIDSVREQSDVEIVFYLYVTDAGGRLVGVVSLRQLLLSAPGTPLGDIMNSRVISVHTDAPQEQVADLVDKYQLLAIPVVDDDKVLVGMVTVDDVIEVIETLTTKDMLKMAGTDESEILTQSPLKVARIRLPWLLAAFAGGLVATGIIQHFETVLVQVLALSAFLPVVMGMAGNVGVQTATVAVRSLATGALDPRAAGVVLFRELRVGLLLGLFYGLVLGACGWWFYGDTALAQVVGLTLLVNMTGAAILAILLPLIFHRLGTDPAIATGPFVTTAIDALGVLNYLLIARAVLGIA